MKGKIFLFIRRGEEPGTGDINDDGREAGPQVSSERTEIKKNPSKGYNFHKWLSLFFGICNTKSLPPQIKHAFSLGLGKKDIYLGGLILK